MNESNKQVVLERPGGMESQGILPAFMAKGMNNIVKGSFFLLPYFPGASNKRA